MSPRPAAPKGSHRSAEHGGFQMSPRPAAPQGARIAVHSTEVSQ